MKRRIKRIVCAVLLCILLCASVFAEATEETPEAETYSESVEEPKQETPSEPAEEPNTDREGTQQPSGESADTPESESSAEPTEEPGAKQTEEPSAEPTGEPTPEPSNEPTPEPSEAPEEEIAPEQTEEPTPTEEPSPTPASENALRITVAGSIPAENGSYILRYRSEQDAVEIAWDAVDGAALYHLEIIAGEEIFFETDTETASIMLTVSDILGNPAEEAGDSLIRILHVTAIGDDGEMPADGSLVLEPVKDNEEEKRPDWNGFPRGGFHGSFHGGFGGFSNRGQPSGEMPEAEQGFHVTPGKALTNTHSNGDKSMRLYGSAEIVSTDEAVNALDIGTETILLDNGSDSFTVCMEGTMLTLTPVSGGEAWSFSAKALKSLRLSGIETLTLDPNGQTIEIPTALEMHGAVYAKLSAQGIVSKDYIFTVSMNDMEVSVAGECYRLSTDYELLEIGG